MRDRILHWLATVVWRRPWTVVLVAIALALFAAAYAAQTLHLNANTDDLIASDRPFMRDYRRFLDEFGDLESIHVVVEHFGQAARAEAAVDALTDRLRGVEGVAAVHSAIEPIEQYRLATRAMPEDELAGLVSVSGAFPSILTGDASRVVADAVQWTAGLVRSGDSMTVQQQERLGAAAVFLLNVVASAREGSAAQSELAFLLGRDRPHRQFFTSDTGRFHFIEIVTQKDFTTLSVIEEPLRRIRAAINEVERGFPELNFGLTGKPVLQADEMATSNADMTRAALLAFVLCAALFMWSFGGFWKPLLAVVAFACAGAWTYGFAAVAIGQLNLLSIVFMLVLIGVGMDYGIHVLMRFREYRADHDLRPSIIHSTIAAGRGNVAGALTSSTVFFLALTTTFQGLRELGLIAGGGLLLCVTAMTLVLPALLVIVGRRMHHGLKPKVEPQLRDGIGAVFFAEMHDHPRAVLLVTAVVTAVLLLAPGTLRLEQNLLNLQAEGLQSVQWERRVLEDSAAASWFGAVACNSQEEALAVIERARQRPTIGAVNSVFDIIPYQTQRRTELRALLKEPLPEIEELEAAATEIDKPGLRDELLKAAGSLDLMALGAGRPAPEQARRLKAISDDLKALTDEMKRDNVSTTAVRDRIARNVGHVSTALGFILDGNSLDMRAALPAAVRARSISPGGRFLVMMHPSENVWEYEPMRHFIEDMRAVDPNVTGAPITHFESLGEMRAAFLQMALLAVAAILIILWIDFRSPRDALIAMIPTALGLIWLVKIMAALDISFNLANFFSVPILIGLSVDGSVHILHRFKEKGSTVGALGATRRAVIITSLTTAIGFGCVMLAHHRGLRSLGQVMAMGSITCLLATVIVLPAMLAVLEHLKNRLEPIEDD